MGEFKGSDPAATGKSTQWPKGVSGNPKGRPATKKLTEIYRELLEEGATREEIKNSIRSIITAGKGGAAFILREMADRTEGKVPQAIAADVNLTNNSGERLEDLLARAARRAEQVSDAGGESGS